VELTYLAQYEITIQIRRTANYHRMIPSDKRRWINRRVDLIKRTLKSPRVVNEILDLIGREGLNRARQNAQNYYHGRPFEPSSSSYPKANRSPLTIALYGASPYHTEEPGISSGQDWLIESLEPHGDRNIFNFESGGSVVIGSSNRLAKIIESGGRRYTSPEWDSGDMGAPGRHIGRPSSRNKEPYNNEETFYKNFPAHLKEMILEMEKMVNQPQIPAHFYFITGVKSMSDDEFGGSGMSFIANAVVETIIDAARRSEPEIEYEVARSRRLD
jgi:hypothetical protein